MKLARECGFDGLTLKYRAFEVTFGRDVLHSFMPPLLCAPRAACAAAVLALCTWLVVREAHADATPPPSASACAQEDDCFIDRAGTARSASHAYRKLHLVRERHYLRGLLEESLFLGVGATWYWLEKDNQKDWDLPPLSVRFSKEVMRFDGNTFAINFLWHPLSGGAYYHAARSNDLGLGWSILSASLASAAWEYGFEFKEKVSINDLIVTPVAGIALGEMGSRLGWYLTHPVGRYRPLQRVAAITLGPLNALHNAVDGVEPLDGPADNLGYSADLWHRFSLSAGAALQHVDREEVVSSKSDLSIAFVAVPSYLRPGKFRRFLHDADVSKLDLSLLSAKGKDGEVDLRVETILASFMRQEISEDYYGTSVLVGSSVAYRMRSFTFGDFTDEFAITSLPGLALEFDGLSPRALAHVSAGIHPDFVGIRSTAFESWAQDHPLAVTQSTRTSFGYSYGYGVSASLSADLTFPFVRLGGRAFIGRYESIEGLAREQEKLTHDPHAQELVIDGDAYAQIYPVPESGFYVELSGSLRKRSSRVERYEARSQMLRAGAALGFAL